MNQRKFKKGFGLLEVVITVAIIVVILGGLVAIGRAAEINSIKTQERAQAVYLAQEGLETVRQIRDSNWIDNNNATQWNTLVWENTGLILVPSDGSIYDIKFQVGRFGLITPSTNSDKATIGGVNFIRTIKIENVGDLLPKTIFESTNMTSTDYALKITANVSWTTNGNSKDVAVSEVLTNWRPNY